MTSECSTAKAFLLTLATCFTAGGVYLIIMGEAALGDYTSSNFIFLMSIDSPTERFINQMQTSGAENILETNGIVVLVFGCLIVFVGIIAWISACTESKGLLITLIVCLAAVAGSLIYVIVVAVQRPPEVENKINDRMLSDLGEYTGSGLGCDTGYLVLGVDEWTQSWDELQVGTGCCGVIAVGDWAINATHWDRDNVQYPDNGVCGDGPDPSVVPLSCCKVTTATDRGNFPEQLDTVEFENATACLAGNTDFINSMMCSDNLQTIVEQYSNRVLGVTAAVGALQVFTIVCAVLLLINPSYSGSLV